MSYDHTGELQRQKKPNIVDGQFVRNDEEDGVIPEEFSSEGDVNPDCKFPNRIISPKFSLLHISVPHELFTHNPV